jgi:hypothetical protein
MAKLGLGAFVLLVASLLVVACAARPTPSSGALKAQRTNQARHNQPSVCALIHHNNHQHYMRYWRYLWL